MKIARVSDAFPNTEMRPRKVGVIFSKEVNVNRKTPDVMSGGEREIHTNLKVIQVNPIESA